VTAKLNAIRAHALKAAEAKKLLTNPSAEAKNLVANPSAEAKNLLTSRPSAETKNPLAEAESLLTNPSASGKLFSSLHIEIV